MKQSFSLRHFLPDRQTLPTQILLLSRILFDIEGKEQVVQKMELKAMKLNQSEIGDRFTKQPTQLLWVCLLLWMGVVCPLGCRSPIGHNGMGVSLYQQGRYSEALQSFELAKQVEPYNPDVYYNLASTYHRLGVNAKDAKMIETAESLYNQCLDLAPNHVDSHRGLAVLLVESERSDKAFALLKNWSQRVPTLADARVELARLHQEFNQPKVSEQYLDEALALDPKNANAWAAKGRLREASGELMQAIQNYQQSLAINTSQPELFQRIGALNVRLAQATPPNAIPGANGSTVVAGNTPPNGQVPAPAPQRY